MKQDKACDIDKHRAPERGSEGGLAGLVAQQLLRNQATGPTARKPQEQQRSL
jgi:hypothetical protein